MKPERIPTRLGHLPSDWRVMPLGEVTERDSTPIEVKPNQFYREIGIRSHGKGLFHKDPVKGTTLGAKRVFQVTPQRLVFNIVFAWEGAVGVTSERECGMIASHRFPMFGPNGRRLIDVEFLRRFFQTDLGVRLLGDASPGGAGRNRTLNQKFTAEIPVPVPPVGEQKKITAILSSVDDAINATQAVIDQLAVVKKAMMDELLTRGLPGWHTKFKMTEIGEVPKEWEVVQLALLASQEQHSFVIGPFGSNLVASDYRQSGVPVVFVRDVKPNAFRWKSNVYVSVEKAAELRAHQVRRGDVVITKMGLPAGIAALYPDDMLDGIVTADIVRLRVDASKVHAAYVAYCINGPIVSLQVEQITGGQTRPKITLRDFKAIRCALPPLEEQRRIAEALETIDSRIAAEAADLAGLSVTKSALMSVLLTGEVRVKPDEEAA